MDSYHRKIALTSGNQPQDRNSRITSLFGWLSAGGRRLAPINRLDQDYHWRALMRAAQDGNVDAYGELLRRLLPVLRSLVSVQGVSAEQVEDVVQDVLLTVHRVRHTYNPARPLLPWLTAITNHCILNFKSGKPFD